jgi:predicted DNA-binding protein YlxM (UPF0122 family)
MITDTDKRRFRLYNQKKGGRPRYSIADIARMEGVSRIAIYFSLKKFGKEYKRRQRPKTWV